MDISNVGSFAAAGKFANDNDGDDKGRVKASGGNNTGAQGAAANAAQNTDTSRPTAPVARSGEEDNVIQTKNQGSGKGNGSVDVLA